MALGRSDRATRHEGIRVIGFALLFAALGGCGGGGGDSAPAIVGGGTAPSPYTAGVFPASSTFAARCANPRSGTRDVAGSILLENNWLRSWTHELYLWYREVPDQNPADFTTTDAYFNVLRTSATTASGALKDKFHFTYPTDAWAALSQSGASF